MATFREYLEEKKNKKLNQPFRLPSGSKKKFGVYVKNDKGNEVLVKFGDPNMEIKRDDPDRLKAFRSRHSCDDKTNPKWKARYWSCQMWRKDKSVDDMLENMGVINMENFKKYLKENLNESTAPKLTKDQVVKYKARMVNKGVPVRFLYNGSALNISTGELAGKHTNIMYHPVYWNFDKETAKEIAKDLGVKAVFSS